MTVDVDVSQFPTLEADLVVAGVVSGEGSIVVAASPPDFSVDDSNLFFYGQRV